MENTKENMHIDIGALRVKSVKYCHLGDCSPKKDCNGID